MDGLVSAAVPRHTCVPGVQVLLPSVGVILKGV